MQLLTGPAHDRCHALNGVGAYEWWYTDALSHDGAWGVVAILFRGMPMSPAYLSAPAELAGGYALSVYHRGTRVAFAFGDVSLEQCDFSCDTADVRVGQARLKIDDDGRMHVLIERVGRGIERSVRVHLVLDAASTATSADAFGDTHGWVLARPRANAHLKIDLGEGSRLWYNVADESAVAYHDHNMGRREMSADFGDWYWGRVHGRTSSIVYLTTPGSRGETPIVVDVSDVGQVRPWTTAVLKLQQRGVNFMGLAMHRRIVLEGVDAQGSPRSVVCDNEVVCEDGPFYQRYISQWTDNGVVIGSGMSEYMDVQRLRAPWIRPFLRLPWISHHTAEQQ